MSQAYLNTPLFHISRNFVEFGTFTAAEITAFKQRGVLRDHDYVRADHEPHWMSLRVWLAEITPVAAGAALKKKPAVRKRPATTKTSKRAADQTIVAASTCR